MILTVLSVPDCPHLPALERRLAVALEEHPGVTVHRHVIADEREAAERGMLGSPTILINGTDPFARPGQRASLSCRMYPGSDGVPSADQLREALREGLAAAPGVDQDWIDEFGRAGRGRIAPAGRGLRPVHQAILLSFATAGQAPGLAALHAAAAPYDLAQVLAELADGDFIYRDQAGQISAAYPFSAGPTLHRVRIDGPDGAVSAHAMCAIDALGIARMLHLPVRIASADPATGEPVTVTMGAGGADHGGATWQPATAVVFVGRTADGCPGSSADVCCGYINFFASQSSADTWASAHREVTGGILTQDRAVEVGERIFGHLLD